MAAEIITITPMQNFTRVEITLDQQRGHYITFDVKDIFGVSDEGLSLENIYGNQLDLAKRSDQAAYADEDDDEVQYTLRIWSKSYKYEDEEDEDETPLVLFNELWMSKEDIIKLKAIPSMIPTPALSEVETMENVVDGGAGGAGVGGAGGGVGFGGGFRKRKPKRKTASRTKSKRSKRSRSKRLRS